MLTLYYAPQSRATRAIALLKELDAIDAVRIETVSIARQDGSGSADPRNPHPEGKVPFLLHDGAEVRESAAIFLHLADLFPQARMNIPVGHALRGPYLGWFAWYAGVLEPVMVLEMAGLKHPVLDATFRGRAEMLARLDATLSRQPYLMGEDFTAADQLLHSPFAWLGKPGVPAIDAWVDRCTARPAAAFAREFDLRQLQPQADAPR